MNSDVEKVVEFLSTEYMKSDVILSEMFGSLKVSEISPNVSVDDLVQAYAIMYGRVEEDTLYRVNEEDGFKIDIALGKDVLMLSHGWNLVKEITASRTVFKHSTGVFLYNHDGVYFNVALSIEASLSSLTSLDTFDEEEKAYTYAETLKFSSLTLPTGLLVSPVLQQDELDGMGRNYRYLVDKGQIEATFKEFLETYQIKEGEKYLLK